MAYILFLMIYEARNPTKIEGNTLEEELLLLPLVRPDHHTIGNGPKVYKNVRKGPNVGQNFV